MKSRNSVIALLALLALGWWSLYRAMPATETRNEVPENEFSVTRAMSQVEKMSQQPHGLGFAAHTEVRTYLIDALEELGLEVETQMGFTAGNWANLCRPENILARIPGSGDGKALVLLSHYDSNPHSSFGASDAASGVATIVEGLRAFLAQKPKIENDIIVLFTDAEELGLNGADLFVNQHPWAEDVGLVLNFEARGSGGPSIMLIETNRGNARLIDEFVKAKPEFPVANSLAYSIYKMLPNDTDLTVFREDADIEGFNFAFIDDHFDYHTANDRPERLDLNTLQHQGSYLMPLLTHFSQVPLDDLKSLNDKIYFNMPFFGLIHYPYEWVMPMLVMAGLVFSILLFIGFKKNKLQLSSLLKALGGVLAALIICGLLGYYIWPFLKWAYPQYGEMLHGFTYNGYYYILATAALSIAICFWILERIKQVSLPHFMAVASLIWLLISAAAALYLKGASFVIIPVFALLAGWAITLYDTQPRPVIQGLLTIPAIWMLVPFIQLFPVGLGLKMLIAASLLSGLLYFLLSGLVGTFPNKKRYALVFLVVGLGCLLGAHFNSGWSEEQPRPSSLVYVADTAAEKAWWATYDQQLSDWNGSYFQEDASDSKEDLPVFSSKYSTGFAKATDAPLKDLATPDVLVLKDTVLAGQRAVEFIISSKRAVNRMDIYTNDIALNSATVNGVQLDAYYLENRRRNKLLTHYVRENDSTHIQLSFPEDNALELRIFEASNDLLENPQFSVPPRPANQIPKPFVLNDAVILYKNFRFD